MKDGIPGSIEDGFRNFRIQEDQTQHSAWVGSEQARSSSNPTLPPSSVRKCADLGEGGFRQVWTCRKGRWPGPRSSSLRASCDWRYPMSVSLASPLGHPLPASVPGPAGLASVSTSENCQKLAKEQVYLENRFDVCMKTKPKKLIGLWDKTELL